jgi:serine/threonine protein kinase
VSGWRIEGVVLGAAIGRGAAATVHRGHVRGAAPGGNRTRLTQPGTRTVAPTASPVPGSSVHAAGAVEDTDDEVVIKVAHPTAEARSAVMHEATVLRRLGDREVQGVPSLVRVAIAERRRPQDGTAERSPALVLRPAGYRSLRDLLRTTTPHGSATTDDAAGAAAIGAFQRSVFAHVAAILADVHGAGVVHGDLSPANIALHETGAAMILDFDNATIDGESRTNHITGTPPFVAPEVLGGEPRTGASDVFSLALVMVLALVPDLVPPHPGTDLAATLVEAGCAPALACVLASGAALEPSARPSAAVFHERLTSAGPAMIHPRSCAEGVDVEAVAEPGMETDLEADIETHATAKADDEAGEAASTDDETDAASTDDETDVAVDVDQQAITVDFGPRPPRPDATAAAPRRRLLVASTAAAILGCFLVLVGGLQLLGAGDGSAADRNQAAGDATVVPGNAPVDGSTPTTDPPTPRTPCVVPRGDGTVPRPPVTMLEADVDASGCAATIEWRADTAEATVQTTGERHRFQLGVAGDVLLVGDWDGDGRGSPALYRPPTGEVFEFERWASPDRPDPTVTGRSTGVRGGQARVRHVDGHDAVDIEPPRPER